MAVVLVVDDDELLRTGIARLIEMRGHTALAAATVREGMEQLAAGPSIIVLDLNLPDGHGTLILNHVRNNALAIRVAVLSGSADAALNAQAKALGPDVVFRKPPNWDRLLEWIGPA
jgi:CheY-like chemotaxis protein